MLRNPKLVPAAARDHVIGRLDQEVMQLADRPLELVDLGRGEFIASRLVPVRLRPGRRVVRVVGQSGLFDSFLPVAARVDRQAPHPSPPPEPWPALDPKPPRTTEPEAWPPKSENPEIPPPAALVPPLVRSA